ncbi:MAG TPA: hypothetical protein VHD83_10115 [Puia sp.]|nr:hypothetical protein [Puia sp.]
MQHLNRHVYKWLIILLLPYPALADNPAVTDVVTYQQDNLIFRWDPVQDSAKVFRSTGGEVIWQGSLLPSFWLETDHHKLFVKAAVTAMPNSAGLGELALPLQIGSLGTGTLIVTTEKWGVRFRELNVTWTSGPPAVIEMYFGASDKAVKDSPVWPTWDRPFLPDWNAFGYCIPGAKEGPAQSYFRNWDFGLTNIALGSYGPSMGAPYGAAYPKPLYFAGMGSDDGFIALGAGSIPDAALSLRVEATRGCFQYVYNEDVWGAPKEGRRVWTEPLRITLGGNALMAFTNYYRSFPARSADGVQPPVPFFNTWGLWREKKYTIPPIAGFARQLGSAMLVLDDGWEISQGSGRPDTHRFPQLADNLKTLHDGGMTHGLWETLGWITDTAAAGLTSADLIVDRHGRPCKANWNFDPTSTSFYCLDISSEKAREFLRRRTIREMQELKPSLIKLDFGYGLPSPHMGVPRDPKYRGERQSVALIRLIADAARSVSPNVAIMYYSISPLTLEGIDLVSLDDQGDLWYDIAGGHGEWSIWASLLSDRNVGIAGSSGYKWEPDDEVVLNTAIIGCPGASLPITQPGGQPIRDKYFCRRLAINKWYRRTLRWQPLWLNSSTGDFEGPPRLRCWGRKEGIRGGDSILTALALRGEPAHNTSDPVLGRLDWKGRWALISQDDKDIFASSALALIPFDPGELTLPRTFRPAAVTRLGRTGESAFEQWEWNDGKLTIHISEAQLENTAGFLIR